MGADGVALTGTELVVVVICGPSTVKSVSPDPSDWSWMEHVTSSA
jgi:hypothetical protein